MLDTIIGAVIGGTVAVIGIGIYMANDIARHETEDALRRKGYGHVVDIRRRMWKD
jgi:hypothetical protein